MRATRTRAAAAVAALFALAGLVGSAVFLAAREDGAPSPTTSTSTPTSTTVGDDAATEALVEALLEDLDVVLTRDEASCIAEALVKVVDISELGALAGGAAPLPALSPDDRDRLVRGVVGCVPAPKAAELLGSPTTTAPPVELPDEGG